MLHLSTLCSRFFRAGWQRRCDLVLYGGLLSMVLLGGTGCFSGSPLRTKAYTWRSEVYTKEKKQVDWFVPPANKAKAVQHRKQLGICAKQSMRPYLEELKKFTRQCTELSHTFHRTASTSRVGYTALLVAGVIGGSAVVAAPIFTVIKIPDAPFDPAIALTVFGATISAVSLLWLQTGEVGRKSNQSFKKYADLVRLIQTSEIQWQTQVCHAASERMARLKASILLKGLAQQCVKDVPNVKVNPDVFKKINEQQTNVKSVLTKYQDLQNHMDLQTEVRDSQATLKRLVARIEKQQAALHSLAGAQALQAHNALTSLCDQAKSEYRRYRSLRNESSSHSSKVGERPAGSWAGLCGSLKKNKKRQLRLLLVQQYKDSEKRFKRLLRTIDKTHAQIEQKPGPKAASQLQQRLGLTCAQARQEYRRMQSLWSQANAQPAQKTPAGAWLGTCKAYSYKSFRKFSTKVPRLRKQ